MLVFKTLADAMKAAKPHDAQIVSVAGDCDGGLLAALFLNGPTPSSITVLAADGSTMAYNRTDDFVIEKSIGATATRMLAPFIKGGAK